MKITLSVNLGGYSFNIDEDAYDELRAYLENLGIWFAQEESSGEILNDIEARIAELLRAKLSDYKQVITIEDVKSVISVLGTPEDIAGKNEGGKGGRAGAPGIHRMYRDPDNRLIGGVCAGMAAYWHTESLVVRIIFLALVFAGGMGLLIYLILWIVLPEARTTAQKIEMRGEPVDIHNIKESVKREFEQVRKKMNL